MSISTIYLSLYNPDESIWACTQFDFIIDLASYFTDKS